MPSLRLIGANRATKEDFADWNEYDVYSALGDMWGYADLYNSPAYNLLLIRASELYSEFNFTKNLDHVVFVTGWASPLETVRKSLMVGLDGRCFQDRYLGGITVPHENISVLIEKDFHPLEHFGAVIVSVGTGISPLVRDLADVSVPHPSVVRKSTKSPELLRKMTKINQILLDKRTIYKHTGFQGPDSVSVQIQKSLSEKRIVYGVVMSSYGPDGIFVDAHGDHITPSAIEDSAHNFKGQIGLQHSLMLDSDDARVVESHVEPYPTKEDYTKAMLGEDHSVTKRTFGDDVVYSGDWVLGVKLSERAWDLFQKGEINAFSPGGTGTKAHVEAAALPKVTFLGAQDVS